MSKIQVQNIESPPKNPQKQKQEYWEKKTRKKEETESLKVNVTVTNKETKQKYIWKFTYNVNKSSVFIHRIDVFETKGYLEN